MNHNFSVIWATAHRNLISDLRSFPLDTFFERIVNGIFSVLLPIAAYYLLFHKSVSNWFTDITGTSDYISYVLIGQMISMIGFSSLTTTGKAVLRESIEGTFDQVLLSPVNRMYYFLGCYIEKMVLDGIEFVIMLAVCYLLGLRLPLLQIPLLIPGLLLVSVSGFLCSFFVIVLFIHSRSTYLIENSLFYIINLLAGVYYPLEAFQKPVQLLGNLIPVTKCISIVRELLLEGMTFSKFAVACMPVLGLSAVYFVTGYYLFKKRYESRLIERLFH